jgi:hypothetical protein
MLVLNPGTGLEHSQQKHSFVPLRREKAKMCIAVHNVR